MENETIITKEDVLRDLADAPISSSKEAEYLYKTQLPKDLAALVFAAYTKGVDKYFGKYFQEQCRADIAEGKFNKLAVKVAEQMIGL